MSRYPMSKIMRLPTPLLHRKDDVSKGDFGHIFILAGSLKFSGAALLCSEAAMRSGAGLVTLAVPKSIARPIIKNKIKEIMLLPLPETSEGSLALRALSQIKNFSKKADVMVIGPGLDRSLSTQALVRRIIVEINKPMVIDADGLNALDSHLKGLKVSRSQGLKEMVMTPHPGEMARLLGIGIKKVQGNRKEIAEEFAKEYKVIVVLKGHHTVVADCKGNLYINKTGNPGMATAGSGDVLAGMIAAFLGQGLKGFEAAKYAVYLHGLAGDLAAREKTEISLIASDIIDKIPAAIKKSS